MRFSQVYVGTLLVLAAAVIGCKSTHEKDVTSNYRTQWTTVMADTKTTTDAAKSVLKADDLKDVTSSSTNVDGMAAGREADGTNVNVTVKRKDDNTSEVSVRVGTMGDPTLGAQYTRRIKEKAEAK